MPDLRKRRPASPASGFLLGKCSPDRSTLLAHGSRPPAGRASLQKPCSHQVWWAREELNLRPLPCQIQRAPRGQYVAPLRILDDGEKAAGKCRCQCPGDPTIRHAFPAVVLLPMAVGCCPFAARRQWRFQSLTSCMPYTGPWPITADMADELQFGRLLGTVIDCCSPLARGSTAGPAHRAVHAEPHTSRSTPPSAATEGSSMASPNSSSLAADWWRLGCAARAVSGRPTGLQAGRRPAAGRPGARGRAAA